MLKSHTHEKTVVVEAYPCLKEYENGDFIVLFYKPEEGTVVFVKNTSGWGIGEYSDSWTESSFHLYDKAVTLSN